MRKLTKKAKIIAAFGIVTGAAAIAWYQFDVANTQASHAIARSEYRRAERWLQIARWTGNWPKSRLLQARLNRKLGHLQYIADDLQVARTDPTLETRVQLEAWLTDIQGRHSPRSDERFYKFLADGTDQSEVCEAYVRGCIASYQLAIANHILDLWQSDFSEIPQPHYYRARLLEHKDNAKAAQQEYRASLDLTPTFAPSAYGLAKLLEDQKEYAQAIRYYEVAKEHGYHPQPGELGIARCYRLQGQRDAAQRALAQLRPGTRDELTAAWTLVGESIQAYREAPALETGYLAADLGNHQQAIERFREALSVNPRNWRSRYQLAMALSRANQRDESASELKLFETASQEVAECERLLDELKSDPDNTESRFRIGTMLWKHVSESQGVIWLESVLDRDPKHVSALTQLTSIFEEKAAADLQVLPIARRYRERLDALQKLD